MSRETAGEAYTALLKAAMEFDPTDEKFRETQDYGGCYLDTEALTDLICAALEYRRAVMENKAEDMTREQAINEALAVALFGYTRRVNSKGIAVFVSKWTDDTEHLERWYKSTNSDMQRHNWAGSWAGMGQVVEAMHKREREDGSMFFLVLAYGGQHIARKTTIWGASFLAWVEDIVDESWYDHAYDYPESATEPTAPMAAACAALRAMNVEVPQ